MTVLFGVHGMTAALTTDAARSLMDRMGRRAGVTAIPLASMAAITTIATDGVAFGVCQHKHPGETLPSPTAQGAHLWLALHGRLDNRAELAAMLKLPIQEFSAASDAVLVLAAYRQFGLDCVQHLLGDWAFALWDAARQSLLLARDATGNSALFWWQGGGQLLFATSLPTLLVAGPVPTRPNPRWIAGLLTVFYDPAHPGATAFADVFAVPPGHFLSVRDGRAELGRWWHPEALPPLDDTPLPQLEDRFLALYDDAVRECLKRRNGSVAATLSGGLDSGSVVALAAPMLAEQGQRLTGYVHTPRFVCADRSVNRTHDEWPLAESTALFVGNVDAVACPTDQISPIDGMQRWLDMAAVPSHAPSNWYWMLDIVQRASSAGASVLLTGQAGNSTVSYDGTGDLRPMLRRSGLAAVLRELRAEEAGWPVAVRDRIVKPALRPGWHACRRAAAQRVGVAPGWYEHGLLRPDLADGLKLDIAMRHAGHDPSLSSPSPRRLQQFRLGLLNGVDNGLAAWSELGAAHVLAIRDPTRDRRLVEFCWRLPDEIFWAHGRRRGLVRRGLRDRLPREVMDCTRKGLQSSDIRQRLQDCRDEFMGQVDAVCRHPVAREWIDTDRLAASAAAAVDDDHPESVGAAHVAHVLRALAAGMFIVRHA